MERLQKVIAHAGIASRRKAEELITQGKVAVNGEIVKTGARAKKTSAGYDLTHIFVGAEVCFNKYYYIQNKSD